MLKMLIKTDFTKKLLQFMLVYAKIAEKKQ